MSKPYTEDDFSSQITQDRNWRLKELSDLKSVIVRSDSGIQTVLLRSLVAICYAHWEGSVRFAARKYMEHIALRRLRFGQLERQFLRNYFMPRLAAMASTKSSVAERCALVDDILSAGERRFSRVNEELINTKSNLNFDVFADICLVCGIGTSEFQEQKIFIDIVLLKRRNAIAHGEETSVDISDLNDLTSKTIFLMRGFGDLLENQIYLKNYAAN